MVNKKVSLKQKHEIVQTGGFAPALLAPLIKPVIAPLAGKVLSGAVGGLVNKIRKTPRHRRFLFHWHGQDHAVGGSQDVAAAGTSSSEPPSPQHRYLRPGHASHPSEDKSQWWKESETIQPGLATLSRIPRPSTSSSSSTSYNDIEGYLGRSLGCCSQTKHDEKKSTGLVGAHQKTTRHGLDRKGELVFEGEVIKGSNIMDLVNDVLRNRKSFDHLHGWRQFARALPQSNVPRDLVGNRRLSDWMHHEATMSDRHSTEVEITPLKRERYQAPLTSRTPSIRRRLRKTIKKEPVSGKKRKLEPFSVKKGLKWDPFT